MCQAKKKPEKHREKKQKEKAREEMVSMVEATTNVMLDSRVPITSCDQVKRKVE